MNTDMIAGNWEQFKGQIQRQWGKLTNDDLDVLQGNVKLLAGKLQERYGLSKEEAELQAEAFFDDANENSDLNEDDLDDDDLDEEEDEDESK